MAESWDDARLLAARPAKPGLFKSEPGTLTDSERDALWKLFRAIGRIWESTADDSESMRSQWLEFIETRCNEKPSYLLEYQRGVRVLKQPLDCKNMQTRARVARKAMTPPAK